jgi:hypothetical protein
MSKWHPISSKAKALFVEHKKLTATTIVNIVHVSRLSYSTNPLPVHVHSPSQQTQIPVFPFSSGSVTSLSKSLVPPLPCERLHTLLCQVAVSRPVFRGEIGSDEYYNSVDSKMQICWMKMQRNGQRRGSSNPALPPPEGSGTPLDTFGFVRRSSEFQEQVFDQNTKNHLNTT